MGEGAELTEVLDENRFSKISIEIDDSGGNWKFVKDLKMFGTF